jgi:hypothetical protein
MRLKMGTLLTALLLALGIAPTSARTQVSPLKFEVTVSAQLSPQPVDGRLFVILGKPERFEPRQGAGITGMDSPPMLARDVTGLTAQKGGVIDASCVAFPVNSLAEIKPGEYVVQAVLDTNLDIKGLNSPGNLYSKPVKMELDPAKSATIKLQLTEQLPEDKLPPDTEFVKFVKLKSELLSKFWGRPIYLRAGVILPRDFDKEPNRRYPVRVKVGGFGSRYTGAMRFMAPNSPLRKVWQLDDAPRMLQIHLDGAGPLGDPYQVNSDNHGPYGDAVTQELIPFIEQKYRGIGQGWARVVDGGSTGGWVSLALQIFYPDFFYGAWSACADGVDFRAFQLVNIYEDKNAYVNKNGFERPGMREVNGDVHYTMRHELQMENVLGRGDSWAMSGGQWGAWNATYGPRGAGGRPVPLWDPKTGEINRAVTEHWKKYDLRLYLEQNWATLAPKLKGKLHVWMGDADNYFLNNAMHMLDESLKKAVPPFEGKIEFSPGKGHCWMGLTEQQTMTEMDQAMKKP